MIKFQKINNIVKFKQMKKHSKKFLELMQRTEKIDEIFHFTEDEIKFLGDEDLLALGKKFPNESHYYMLTWQ